MKRLHTHITPKIITIITTTVCCVIVDATSVCIIADST